MLIEHIRIWQRSVFLYNIFSPYRESVCLLQIAANEYVKALICPLRSAHMPIQTFRQ